MNGSMYTLDTNTIIYYLKNDPHVVDIFNDIFHQDDPVYISCITELELFSFSGLTTEEVEQINKLLQTLHIIPVDSQLARLAGFLRSTHKIKTPDSIIAATAIFTGTKLLTRNIEDFKKLSLLRSQKI